MDYAGVVYGQTFHLGDLYTFSDGSQGIVIYVDPDNAGCGTVAALNDLEEPYALWTGTMPSALYSLTTNSFNYCQTTSWAKVGLITTQTLRSSGVSPAAEAVDVTNGWYIPDVMQLRRLMGLITVLQNAFEASNGDVLGMLRRSYWSSTRITSYFYSMSSNGYTTLVNGKQSHFIRAVRDFGPDTARVFWADSPTKTDTTVTPLTTTAYEALLVYNADTVALTSSSCHSR